MIVDSHIHCGGPDKTDGMRLDYKDAVKKLEESGVDRGVIFPFNSPDERGSFITSNDYIIEAVRNYPEKFIGFMRINPHRKDKAIKEMDRAHDHGLRGLKLHPMGEKFGPEHPYLPEIMKRAEDYSLPVVFDTGKNIFPNKAFVSLAKKFPGVNIIMAHLRGGDSIDVVNSSPNLYQGVVKARNLEEIKRAVEVLGAERVIAGSDYPYADPKYELIDKFKGLGISGGDLKLIHGKNILDLIK